MNNLAVADPSGARAEIPLTLSAMLDRLLRYGHPRLSHIDSGWYCKIEMYVGDKGVDFKIASDFGHPTPEAAARETIERLAKTLQTLGKS